MNPHGSRVAAVFGSRQGSGYLLGPRLVLTAGHVVQADRADAIVVGGVGKVPCQVVWRRHDVTCDAALLVAESDLVPATESAAFTPLRWGELVRLDTQEDCQAIGFPLVQRDERGNLDSEQLTGRVKPGSSVLRGRYVLESDGPPPQSPGDGSPWSGLSGAGLFCQGTLIGVVVTAPVGWNHGRVEAVPVRMIADDPAFRAALARHGGADVTVTALDELTPDERRDHEVEVSYRRYVANRYGRLETLGHHPDAGRIVWPLDSAFLALELAETTPRIGPPALDTVPGKRFHAALGGRTRVLLQGTAGSGKTTLMHWLAVRTAQGDLPSELGHLQGRVPFVVPLRTLDSSRGIPRVDRLLEELCYPDGGGEADGWLSRLLKRGRVLLLIDGIDEVRHDRRRHVRNWLENLLAAHPSTAVVVTTRPSAVRQDWLAGNGFSAFSVLPMSPADVGTFIDRWFAAMRHSDDRFWYWGDFDDLTRTLRATVVARPSLSELAASPRLCALLCALWLEQGYDRSADALPDEPLWLQSATLDLRMRSAAADLRLAGRDMGRDIGFTEGIHLDLAQQKAFLRCLALWLVVNGAADMSYARACAVIEQDRQGPILEMANQPPALGRMTRPRLARLVLDHLMIRAGALCRTSTGRVAFEHSTFRDYFAAQAIVAAGHVGFLVKQAHDPQYADVVHMTLGLCDTRDAARLLVDLVERGDREPAHRTWLHLLATASLQYAERVDPEVRARVLRRARALVPPRDDATADVLAEAGTAVLDLLPGPDGLTAEEAGAVVLTASKIGGPGAAAVVRRFEGHDDPAVSERVRWAYDRLGRPETDTADPAGVPA
ncbi:NACHT domain-containing protein [Streptomyces phaeofaciens]|uniref:NACHT domain-containing protein n=1 Tax=Streptomyces phaeofaciens TaxID=68254 RepID=UPI00369DDE55